MEVVESMPENTHCVAVFNASDDTVEMLITLLSQRGYRGMAGQVDKVKSGEINFVEFLQAHKPSAIIWDIAPPYDRNWHFFQLIRDMRSLDRSVLVLTTTHKRHLDTLAGHDTGAIEIIGKPYDIESIVNAVADGIRRRDGAAPRQFGQARN
jgi:DNA-binding response OmpR family regulator